MIIILAVLFAFVLPVLFILWREWKRKKAEEEKEGVAAPRVKEPLSPGALVKVTLVLCLVGVPVFFLSSLPYRYFPPDSSALKIGFKHSGKRVVDCDEAELIKKAGERYRESLKAEGRVKMDIGALTGCPRERFPVAVALQIDGRVILDREYSPTGIKKDMASYIYEEFTVTPGPHKVSVTMYDRERTGPPGFSLGQTVDFKPGEIKVVWFDDKANMLILE